MAKALKMSATMAIALDFAMESKGELVRYQGGFWAPRGMPMQPHGAPADYVNTTTIEALVARGKLKYTEFRTGRNGEFPIAVAVADELVP